MKIALTNMDIAWENTSVNQRKCVELIKRASDLGARLILFPEETLTGFTMNVNQFGETIERGGQTKTVAFFQELSYQYRMAIGFGYIAKREKKGENHFAVVDGGHLLGDYVKLHPFSYGGEDGYYLPGDTLVSVRIDDVNFGLFVCYDLRFPEIFQKAAEENEVIAVIANWPKSRVAQWRALLLARAIETQSLVLGVNRMGEGGNLIYEKSSIAFDECGNVPELRCYTTSFGDECLIGEMNIEEIQRYREKFPIKKDRRKQLYQSFYEE